MTHTMPPRTRQFTQRIRNTFGAEGHVGLEGLPAFFERQASSDESVLLHGDLHHGNILSVQRKPWLAIDPKGVIGEPAYELGTWLRNPFPQILRWDDPAGATLRRVDQMVGGPGIAQERILGWTAYQAALSSWWSFEDRDPEWESGMRVAKILAGCLP